MVPKLGKFQVMFLGQNTNQKFFIEIDDLVIKPKNSVKLHGITIDSKLNFTDHVKSVYTRQNKMLEHFRKLLNTLMVKKQSYYIMHP